MPYLTKEGLKHLEEHKYASGGYSWLDNKMNAWWLVAVELLPMWLAPNLVTLLGTICLLSSYWVLTIYCPDLQGEAPSSVYLYLAFGLFLYQTLDAIDGKQARRTNSASPLGQLFDHGCDGLGTTFIALSLSTVLQFGPSWKTILLQLTIQIPFFFAQWEEYHLRSIRTNVGGLGVTEGQHAMIAIYLLTACTGPGIWNTALLGDFLLKDALFLGLGMGPAFVAFNNLTETLPQCAKKGTLWTALWQLLPIMLMSVCGLLWSTVYARGGEESVFVQHPHLLSITIGLLFTHLTNFMIVSSMSQMPYPAFHPVLLPFPLLFANSMYHVISEAVFLWVYGLLVFFVYGHFVYFVIEEITTHLGIRCLVITKKK